MNKKKEEKTQQDSKKVDKKLQKKKKKSIFINISILVLLFGFIFAGSFFSEQNTTSKDTHSISELVSHLKNEEVSKVVLSADGSELSVDVYQDDKKNRDKIETIIYPNITGQGSVSEKLDSMLGEENKINWGNGDSQVIYDQTEKTFWAKMSESNGIQIFIQIAIFVAIAVFLLKKLGKVNSKSMSFGNSRAKLFEDNSKDKVTFNDVAGNEEAKQELFEVIDFLKRPEAYKKMGAKTPKGILLVGSPGNGKTLMAKAIAGEAKAPFLYVSGSEFVEMFVGVGAGRVRDLFKQAKKKAPCVIFIDEIDAVGRSRGSGMGTGNDEREQTLNQILVEMDGFEPNESVIVIAATNREDVLDKALLRPGRFDRKVRVTAPDRKEREQILKVHTKGKKLAKNINLGIIAKRTPGFSGADLMNVLNEAAILAVRENEKVITNNILRESIEKVLMGPSLKSKIVTEEDRKLTAYHEAGHALVGAVLPEARKVQKISIIPRSNAGGYTFTSDEGNDPSYMRKGKILAEIAVLYGGYIVEKLIFGEVSTGPSSDLKRATEMAKEMVMRYGMSDLGPVTFGENKTFQIGLEIEKNIPYSEETIKAIDSEVNQILEIGYKIAEKIIKKHKEYLDKIVTELLDKEILELEEFEEIVKEIMPKQ